MKIVHIVTRSDAIGGAHVHVRDVCEGLQRRGHEVTVLLGGHGPFVADLHARGIACRTVEHLVRKISPVSDALALLAIRRALRELSPDLVSTHSSKAGWLGRIAAWSLGIPVTFTAHGWAFTEGVSRASALLYRTVERFAAPFADRIITVSEYDRRLALRYHVASAGKMKTILNGMPRVDDALCANPGAEPPRIAMVARFDAPKDHGTLLRALGRLRELPWTLDLIGDGPTLDATKVLAEALGLTDRVRFLGNRDDVGRCLSRCQLLALTSDWEGLPLSVLEGMRAGLPVVASDVGGIPEAVQDGATGLLAPRRDEGALASQLSRLLVDRDLRVRMGAAGRERFQREFTFDVMLERTLDIYTSVLQAPGQSRGQGRAPAQPPALAAQALPAQVLTAQALTAPALSPQPFPTQPHAFPAQPHAFPAQARALSSQLVTTK